MSQAFISTGDCRCDQCQTVYDFHAFAFAVKRPRHAGNIPVLQWFLRMVHQVDPRYKTDIDEMMLAHLLWQNWNIGDIWIVRYPVREGARENVDVAGNNSILEPLAAKGIHAVFDPPPAQGPDGIVMFDAASISMFHGSPTDTSVVQEDVPVDSGVRLEVGCMPAKTAARETENGKMLARLPYGDPFLSIITDRSFRGRL